MDKVEEILENQCELIQKLKDFSLRVKADTGIKTRSTAQTVLDDLNKIWVKILLNTAELKERSVEEHSEIHSNANLIYQEIFNHLNIIVDKDKPVEKNTDEEDIETNKNLEIPEETMADFGKISKLVGQNIPYFSGDRSGNLSSEIRAFISCCDTIYNNVEEGEKECFLAVLKNKFRGDAFDLISNSAYKDFEELKSILNDAYIEKRSFQSYTDELKRCQQRPGENLKNFGKRIKILLEKVKTQAKEKYVRNNEALLTNIEDDAIRSYKKGIINEKIKLQVLFLKKPTLAEIISEAETIEEDMGILMQHFVKKPFYNADSTFRSNGYKPNFHYNSSGNQGKYETKKLIGQGQTDGGNLEQGPTINRKREVQMSSNMVCGVCGKFGHLRAQCRSKPNTFFCTNCNRHGHTANFCRNSGQIGKNSPTPVNRPIQGNERRGTMGAMGPR